MEEQSERTYNWAALGQAADLAVGKTGAEYLELLANTRPSLNPFWATIGLIKLEVLQEGKTRLTIQPQAYHYNAMGSVHGGVAASLLDTAAATAVHSTLPKAGALTTMQLSTYYVRPITVESGLMYCYGEIIRVGRRTATSQSRLEDAGGKLYAHATGSFMLFLD